MGNIQQGLRGTLVIKRGVFPTELVTMELHSWKPVFISASEHIGALNLVSSAKQLRASGAILATPTCRKTEDPPGKPPDTHCLTHRGAIIYCSVRPANDYTQQKKVFGLSSYFTSDLKISLLLGVFLAEGSHCNRIRQCVSSCQVTEC